MPRKPKAAEQPVAAAMPVVAMIGIEDLEIAPFNPRRTVNEQALAELAESIRSHGLLQPIVVRVHEGKFQVVCGSRRTRAAGIAGLEEIPAVVREFSDQEAIEAALTENIAREDVEPLEEAQVIDGLSAFYDTDQALADRLGRSVGWVSRRRKLIKLIPSLQESLGAREFALGWYEVACQLTEQDQETVLGRARNWPFDDTADHLRNYLARNAYPLERARFALDQPLGDRPACIGCPHNTASQPDLFGDDEPPKCQNRICFDDKSAKFVERIAEEQQLPVVQVTWGHRVVDAVNFDETIHKGLTKVVAAPGSNRTDAGDVIYVELPEPRPEGEISPEKLKRRAYLATCKRENWIRFMLLEELGGLVAVLGELDVANALANLHYILWRVMRDGHISILDKHRLSKSEFLALAKINGYDEKAVTPESRKALLASLIWEACHDELACKDWGGQNREHQPGTAIQEAYAALGADYQHHRHLFEAQWAEKHEGKKAKEQAEE